MAPPLPTQSSPPPAGGTDTAVFLDAPRLTPPGRKTIDVAAHERAARHARVAQGG
jgi:hypothetical protein